MIQQIKQKLEPLRKLMGATNVVCGIGPAPCSLMLVGEAPGENEDLQDMPFVGRAGDLLNKLLKESGLDRDQIYITNTVKCRPTVGKKNRPPTDAEITACKKVLWDEIQYVNPTLIVSLGAIATKLLAKQQEGFKMGPIVGHLFQLDKYQVMPIWHPSYLLRGNANSYQEALEAFKKAKDIVNG